MGVSRVVVIAVLVVGCAGDLDELAASVDVSKPPSAEQLASMQQTTCSNCTIVTIAHAIGNDPDAYMRLVERWPSLNEQTRLWLLGLACPEGGLTLAQVQELWSALTGAQPARVLIVPACVETADATSRSSPI